MSFPSTLPSYASSDPTMTLATFTHLGRHQSTEADILALATKLGINSSSDNTSVDYKLQPVTTGNQAETQANKSTSTSLGTSDTLYPSQKAAKTYIDTNVAAKLTGSTTSAITDAIIGNAVSNSGTVYGVPVTTGIIGSAAIVGSVKNASLNTTTGEVGGAWNDYSSTSTIVGWSSFTDKVIRYLQIGKTVFVNFALRGTSNSGLVTFTLPIAAKSFSGGTSSFAIDTASGLSMDNGAVQTSLSRIYIDPTVSLSLINVTKNAGSTAWTASGTKDIRGMFFYEIP